MDPPGYTGRKKRTTIRISLDEIEDSFQDPSLFPEVQRYFDSMEMYQEELKPKNDISRSERSLLGKSKDNIQYVEDTILESIHEEDDDDIPCSDEEKSEKKDEGANNLQVQQWLLKSVQKNVEDVTDSFPENYLVLESDTEDVNGNNFVDDYLDDCCDDGWKKNDIVILARSEPRFKKFKKEKTKYAVTER